MENSKYYIPKYKGYVKLLFKGEKHLLTTACGDYFNDNDIIIKIVPIKQFTNMVRTNDTNKIVSKKLNEQFNNKYKI